MQVYPDSTFVEYNPNHEPSGSPTGGQFASKKGNSGSPTQNLDGSGRSAVSPQPGRPDASSRVQAEATHYAVSIGLSPVTHGYATVDQLQAGMIADAFERLPKFDPDPKVQQAYAALGREVQAQWDYAKAQGMTFTPWTSAGQPYQTSTEMANDVRDNRHLFFYTGGEKHPALGSPDATGLTLNDKFRAIHDYFGHAAGGYGFGARGE